MPARGTVRALPHHSDIRIAAATAIRNYIVSSLSEHLGICRPFSVIERERITREVDRIISELGVDEDEGEKTQFPEDEE